jgi:hypothetical protein
MEAVRIPTAVGQYPMEVFRYPMEVSRLPTEAGMTMKLGRMFVLVPFLGPSPVATCRQMDLMQFQRFQPHELRGSSKLWANARPLPSISTGLVP